jgi:hypothetical protein
MNSDRLPVPQNFVERVGIRPEVPKRRRVHQLVDPLFGDLYDRGCHMALAGRTPFQQLGPLRATVLMVRK